jgi:hypothetical protein
MLIIMLILSVWTKNAMFYLVLYMMRYFVQIMGCQTFKPCISWWEFLSITPDAQIMKMLIALGYDLPRVETICVVGYTSGA